MQEMSDASKHHHYAQFISSGDRVVIAHTTTWLDDRGNASGGGSFDRIIEGEETIASEDCALGIGASLFEGDLRRADAVHLSGTDTNGNAIFGDDDRIGFDVFADFPGE
jgi:hypothetical protein